jgi:uncharacterized protein (DUF1778 family)
MSRLTIELTPEQLQRLKAMAALQGKTIQEYILERSLPDLPTRESITEEEALHQLEQLLQSRIEAAERGEISSRTPAQIFEEVRQEMG